MKWKFNRNRLKQYTLIAICLILSIKVHSQPLIDINQEAALRIGIKIWYNECSGKISGLTTWNEGENFASIGIGHFNWYPINRPGGLKDGFPQLIKYLERQGATVPEWLQGENVPPCPWHSRTEFLVAQKTKKMQELRQFLVDTIPMQAQFMVHRLVNAFPKLITMAPYVEREYIFSQFADLCNTPQGMYTLVDYVNFKGEGTGSSAKNKNGWGLLQVIEGMQSAPPTLNTKQAFVWSANRALTNRAQQSAFSSHEHKWLAGWRKRLSTYLDP